MVYVVNQRARRQLHQRVKVRAHMITAYFPGHWIVCGDVCGGRRVRCPGVEIFRLAAAQGSKIGKFGDGGSFYERILPFAGLYDVAVQNHPVLYDGPSKRIQDIIKRPAQQELIHALCF